MEYNIYAGQKRVCTNVSDFDLERRKDLVRNTYPDDEIIVVRIEEVPVQVYNKEEKKWTKL